MAESTPNWWSRNWKWFVPVGCLTVLLLIALFVGGILTLVFGMMKGSDVYAQALDRARTSPAVTAALGTPLEEGLFVSGNWNETGPGGSAELSIPLSGPKGDGTLYVVAKKSAGLWTFSTLVLAAPDGSRIDLLEAPAGESDAVEPDDDSTRDAAPLPDVEPTTAQDDADD
jgi:hypothetical protein